MKGGQLLRVKKLGCLWMVAVKMACFSPALPDRLTCAIQHLFVIGVFPLHQVADDIEQLFAFKLSFLLVDSVTQLPLVARVIDQLRKQHRPSSC